MGSGIPTSRIRDDRLAVPVRTTRLFILGAALVLTVAVTASVIPGCRRLLAGEADGPLRTRFAHYPPEKGFRFAFSREVPPGITSLACTGEAWLGGTNVWLTFQAPARVRADLFRGWQTTDSPAEERRLFGEAWDDALKRYDPRRI